MINLCLVVIATQFSETKKRETAKMKAERAKFTSSSTLSSFTNRSDTFYFRPIEESFVNTRSLNISFTVKKM